MALSVEIEGKVTAKTASTTAFLLKLDTLPFWIHCGNAEVFSKFHVGDNIKTKADIESVYRADFCRLQINDDTPQIIKK